VAATISANGSKRIWREKRCVFCSVAHLYSIAFQPSAAGHRNRRKERAVHVRTHVARQARLAAVDRGYQPPFVKPNLGDEVHAFLCTCAADAASKSGVKRLIYAVLYCRAP
jgi:hypothetical protein